MIVFQETKFVLQELVQDFLCLARDEDGLIQAIQVKLFNGSFSNKGIS
jgi:hypothetical protein